MTSSLVLPWGKKFAEEEHIVLLLFFQSFSSDGFGPLPSCGSLHLQQFLSAAVSIWINGKLYSIRKTAGLIPHFIN